MKSGSLDRCLSLAGQLGSELSAGAFNYFFTRTTLPGRSLSVEEIAEAWRSWASRSRAGKVGDVLHFYLHVPFCSHRCAYCVYYSVAPPDPEVVSSWLRRMRSEIPFWGDAIGGAPLWTMYVGGGTPTVLEPQDLRELLGLVRANFTVRKGGERSFECNPLTLTAEKAAIFRDAGFNRASFGIQSLSPAVLSGVNRGYQTAATVDRAFDILRDARFHVNVDLLQGLPGENSGSMKDTLRWVLKRRPAEITLYGLSPSTPGNVLDRAASVPLSVVASDISGMVADAGYEMSRFETALKITGNSIRQDLTIMAAEVASVEKMTYYLDVPDEPSSLLAIGATTRSQILASMRYKTDLHTVQAPFSTTGAYAIGREMTAFEAQSQYVVYALGRKNGLNHSAFQYAFGTGLMDVFGPGIAEATAAGLLKEVDGVVSHASQDAVERFAVEMLFVPPEAVDAMQAGFERDPSRIKGSVLLSLSAGPCGFNVILGEHRVIPRPAHASGGFAFMVPSPDGCEADQSGGQLTRLFIRLFDAVVSRDRPGSVKELSELLVARGSGLRIAAPEGSVLCGAVMRLSTDTSEASR